jgi:hypothetical protein
MKKLIFTLMALACLVPEAIGQEFLQITTIESVVPAGLGRSRMITKKPDGSIDEIKMENFFSLTGINFNNVRLNDKLITDQISQLTREGWQLLFVTPGVYAADRSTGIFITRYLFRRDAGDGETPEDDDGESGE